MSRFLGLSLLLLMALLRPLFAHNGEMAIAVPVEGIVVDGDLSDWPASMTWQPIDAYAWGDPATDGLDVSGRFTIGYDVGALYVAMEIRDQSIVVDGENPIWQSGDGCELYVDLPHFSLMCSCPNATPKPSATRAGE